jgi:secondary thiamine-phosphate synthase enzyme
MDKFLVTTKHRQELVDVTRFVDEAVRASSIKTGVCVVYCPHTTAAVTINEGADPAVASDIIMGLDRLIPSDWDFRHMEGNSDAHIKATLVGPSETIIIEDGCLLLGTWQKIFFCEFDGPRQRSLHIHVEGKVKR